MLATLLCPGPSLNRYSGGFGGLRLAVNRAALKWPVDVWCCLDWTCQCADGSVGAIRGWSELVLGNPLLLTSAASLASLARHRIEWPGKSLSVETWWDKWPRAGWSTLSATTALVYAAERGATLIEVWGADMAGTADYDGREAGEKRDAERWQRERQIWAETVATLDRRGVEVRRMGLE